MKQEWGIRCSFTGSKTSGQSGAAQPASRSDAPLGDLPCLLVLEILESKSNQGERLGLAVDDEVVCMIT